jgi:arabinofuranosyltransferase
MLFTLVVAAFLIYAGLFIYRTSFVIDGERYFSLFDDAMISMRYAKNFANGYGLVWNPGGERIEGYTNPLWVLYMSVIHLLPISQSKTSLFIQLTAAVLLAVNLYFVR